MSNIDNHGHVWMTDDEYGGYGGDGKAYVEFPSDPDDTFNSSGPCAGPICKRCGYHYCEHCHPDGPPEACEGED